MKLTEKSINRWFYVGWILLTILYLLLRFQNIAGVFLPSGIVIDDTDPYYRLHRIQWMLQNHAFYRLHDQSLSFPTGVNVPWPLGLDLLIALPLFLYRITSQLQIETFAAVVIPFLSLPTLWCAGVIGTLLVNRLFGLALGFMVVCGQTLIIQSEVGRVDHHFLEAMFPIALLMFILKFKKWHRMYDVIWIGIILALAPSFCPQGWIFAPMIFLGCLFSKDWETLGTLSKVFLAAGLASIIPLAFSDRFLQGYFTWIGFSWWSPWIYFILAVISELIVCITYRKIFKLSTTILALVLLVATSAFIISKNSYHVFFDNIQSQIDTVSASTATMATTVEARTPFELSENTWMHGDFYLLILGSICFLYFFFQRRHLMLFGFGSLFIVLTFFQIRFFTFSFFFCSLFLLLFFHDFAFRLNIHRNVQIALFCITVVMMIVPFRPALGLINYKNHHDYYSAVRGFTTFINDEFTRLDRKKDDQSILAHWDYGHWLLYYTDLPVISDPFQGSSAVDVIRLFTSSGTAELAPFVQKHPATYLLLESGAVRSFQWIQLAGKDTDTYFEKAAESPNHEFFKTTEAFSDLFMFRYFFELGLDEKNDHPKDWRLVYISPESNPTDESLPAIKAFEHVKGAQIHVSTRNNSEELYLQADILEKGDATVFQQVTKGVHDFTWTVPYGQYDRGNVKFDGVYVIRDPNGKILYKTPSISEAEVLRGDRIDIFF